MSTMTIDLSPPDRTRGPACAKCNGPTRLAGIEPHPTRDHMDLRTFECVRCQAVQTTVVAVAN